MAYNKRNLLLKIIAIQEIVIKEQKRGATQTWIFENLIKDAFFCSKPAFDKYLARNAKRELEVLDKEEAKKTAEKAAKIARRETEAKAQLKLSFSE